MLLGVLAVLAAVYVWKTVGSPRSQLVSGPIAAAILLLIGYLGHADLGLRVKGAWWAAILVVATAVVYGIGLLIPFVRARLAAAGRRADPLFTALIAVPLATVIPEEIAFRSVMYGLLSHPIVVTAVLFGVWHLRLSQSPAAAAGTFAFTAAAGLLFGWLRHETGGVLAPFALHWAVNGLGVLAVRLSQERPATSS